MMKPFLALLLLSAIFTMEFPKDGNYILILSEENFDEAVKTFPYLFVKFYTPHCAHCKKLAPEFSKAAESLSKQRVQFAQVDGSSQTGLEKRFDIQGYPNLKFFLNGKQIDYSGGRTEADMVTFINKKTATSIKPLVTEEEIEKFKAESRVAALYIGDDKEELFAYEAASLYFDIIKFGASSAKKLATKYLPKGKIVVWKSFDENVQYFEGKMDRLELIEFFKKHATPLIMPMTESTAEMIFTKNVPGLFLFIDKDSKKGRELEKVITSVAELNKGKLQVVVSGVKEGIEKELAEFVGMSAADLPAIRLFDTRKEARRYFYSGEMTEKGILEFIKQWENNELTPFIKSEPIPTEQGAVFKMVGKTFKETIGMNKDVLVKYFAHWDSTCKKLAPVYEKLAKKYKHNDKLLIAEINIDKNETPDVTASSLPTIHLWAAGKKKKEIEYKGPLTLEGLEAFLEDYTTFPFDIIKAEAKSDL